MASKIAWLLRATGMLAAFFLLIAWTRVAHVSQDSLVATKQVLCNGSAAHRTAHVTQDDLVATKQVLCSGSAAHRIAQVSQDDLVATKQVLCNGSAAHAKGLWKNDTHTYTEIYALGESAPWNACRGLEEASEGVGYVRTSNCHVPDLFSAAWNLQHLRFHIVGDSTTLGGIIRFTWRQVQMMAALCPRLNPLHRGHYFHALFCNGGIVGRDGTGTRTWSKFEKNGNLFRISPWLRVPPKWQQSCEYQIRLSNGQGSMPFRQIYSETMSTAQVPHLEDVLIVNAGPWFNIPCDGLNCSYDGVSCMLRMLRSLDDYAGCHNCTWSQNASRFHTIIFEGIDKCSGSKEACLQYNCDYGLSEFAYARTLANFADFVVQYRDRLPSLLVWIDPTPQHFKSGAFSGKSNDHCVPITVTTAPYAKWRKSIADAIFDRFWHDETRNILRVSTYDILEPRWGDHPHNKRGDCTHYCSATPGYQENLRSLLAAILEKQGSGLRPGPVAYVNFDSRCWPIVHFIDSLFFEGLGVYAVNGMLLLVAGVVVARRLVFIFWKPSS